LKLRDKQEQYADRAEAKIMSLAVKRRRRDDGTIEEGIPVKTADGKEVLVIPTIHELEDFVTSTGDPKGGGEDAAWEEIARLRRDCKQISNEKVDVAQQTYNKVERIVKRLEEDMTSLEALLKVSINSIARQRFEVAVVELTEMFRIAFVLSSPLPNQEHR